MLFLRDGHHPCLFVEHHETGARGALVNRPDISFHLNSPLRPRKNASLGQHNFRRYPAVYKGLGQSDPPAHRCYAIFLFSASKEEREKEMFMIRTFQSHKSRAFLAAFSLMHALPASLPLPAALPVPSAGTAVGKGGAPPRKKEEVVQRFQRHE